MTASALFSHFNISPGNKKTQDDIFRFFIID